jgi:hypothetical protein
VRPDEGDDRALLDVNVLIENMLALLSTDARVFDSHLMLALPAG